MAELFLGEAREGNVEHLTDALPLAFPFPLSANRKTAFELLGGKPLTKKGFWKRYRMKTRYRFMQRFTP